MAHKVYAPCLIDCHGGHQGHAHANPLGFLALSDRQTLSGVVAIHALVINVGVLRAQNVMDHSIAPAPAGVRGLDDLVAPFHIERTGRAHMAESVTAQPHKGAGVAFGQAVFSHHAPNSLAFDLWG